MGTTESTMVGGGAGGANKGPFTDAEYASVVQVFTSWRNPKTGRLPREAFAALFAVPTEPAFGEGLFRVFKRMPVFEDEGTGGNGAKKPDPDSLSFAEFFNGVSACSRASDRSIMKVVFDVFDRQGAGRIPYAQIKEVMRLAYQCVALSRCPPPTAPSGPPPAVAPAAKATSSYSASSPSPPRAAGSPTTDAGTVSPAALEEALKFDSGRFTHPIVREHDYDLNRNGSCALMTAGAALATSNDPLASPAAGQKEFPKSDEEEEPVDFNEFYPWVTETVPLLYQCFGAFVYSRICPGLPVPQQLRFQLPRLLAPSHILSSPQQLFGLACACGALQGAWERLYTSEENGLSFNRLAHHILGYRGPTALIIRDTRGYIFGFYTAEAWKESNGFYGSSECFLFRLDPTFVEARPKCGAGSGGSHNYMYLNLKGFSLPHGLGVGGSIDGGFRLFVPESLEDCVACAADGSFEYGPLASSKHFEMEALEVWGTGGEDAIRNATAAQGAARELRAENIAKARKVDKSKFLDSDFDKEMFLAKTFGREGASARDRSGRD